MQLVKAPIDCGANSMFISLSQLRKLELPYESAFTSTQVLNAQVMMSAKESWNVSLLVQYVKHLKLINESEVLVIPMKANDLVLGLPWFKARNPKIDRSKGRLSALQTQNGSQQAKIAEVDRASSLLAGGEDNTHDAPPPDIQLLRASAFGHLLASEAVVEAFAIQLGECQGMLGASLKGITEVEKIPRMLDARVQALAVVAADEWHNDGAWMTATGSPRYEGRH